MRVLIIDDEPLVRLSLQRALRKMEYEVAEAEDGQAGLKVWQEFQPDLVFLDVLMPKMSGPDLLKALPHSVREKTKVVLMSAFTGEYDLAKAQALGAQLFIPKPFDDIFLVVKRAVELV